MPAHPENHFPLSITVAEPPKDLTRFCKRDNDIQTIWGLTSFQLGNNIHVPTCFRAHPALRGGTWGQDYKNGKGWTIHAPYYPRDFAVPHNTEPFTEKDAVYIVSLFACENTGNLWLPPNKIVTLASQYLEEYADAFTKLMKLYNSDTRVKDLYVETIEQFCNNLTISHADTP
jgi:hypothetical protein